MLRPYRIPDECPYLSEDQRELSKRDIKGRMRPRKHRQQITPPLKLRRTGDNGEG